ncbi:Zinc finger protein, partial [Armadillidium nasatum]
YNAGATLATTAAAAAAGGTRLTPPLKRPRLVVPSVRQQQQRAQSPKKVVTTPALDDLRTYSSPDILICGNCRELFSNLSDFLDHRKQYCKLRFTCKCSSFNGSNRDESASLMCALCKENFASAWDLMVHAQAAHMVNIYQLSTKDGSQNGLTEGDGQTDMMNGSSSSAQAIASSD